MLRCLSRNPARTGSLRASVMRYFSYIVYGLPQNPSDINVTSALLAWRAGLRGSVGCSYPLVSFFVDAFSVSLVHLFIYPCVRTRFGASSRG